LSQFKRLKLITKSVEEIDMGSLRFVIILVTILSLVGCDFESFQAESDSLGNSLAVPDRIEPDDEGGEDEEEIEEPTLPLAPRFAIDLSQPVTERLLVAAKAEDVTTIIRYYDHPNETIRGKTIRAHELDLIKEHDLQLAVVFQHNNNKLSSFTSARGTSDADRCLELAEQINQPEESAIYFGVDGGWGNRESEFNQILSYFEKASPLIRDGGYRIGVYGSGLICRRLVALDLVDHCWLANAKAWPEYQNLFESEEWTMVQSLPTPFAGHEVDFNTINPMIIDFGQFKIP